MIPNEEEMALELLRWLGAGDLERRLYTIDRLEPGTVLITLTAHPLGEEPTTVTVEGTSMHGALAKATAWARGASEEAWR